MIRAHSQGIWSVMILAGLTFAPPTVIALTAILSSSSVTKAVMLAQVMADDTVRLLEVYRFAAHPTLLLSLPMHAWEVEEPLTCQLAVELPLPAVTATF